MSDDGSSRDRVALSNNGKLDERITELLKYNDEIELILSPGSPTYTSLVVAVARWLKQYRISGLFSPSYVINEAYLRGENSIRKKGQKISSYLAWLRRTCFNIIRELSRKEVKCLPLLIEPAEECGTENVGDYDFDFNLDREMMRVKLAFQILEPEDQELLNLKIVDGLSWKEIRKEFSLRGMNFTESALRKRKERALKKLRNNYHSFNSLDSPFED